MYYFFFFNDTATTEIYTLSLHDALPIWNRTTVGAASDPAPAADGPSLSQPVLSVLTRQVDRSEEHTSELQSLTNLVCRLLLEKKKKKKINKYHIHNPSHLHPPPTQTNPVHFPLRHPLT